MVSNVLISASSNSTGTPNLALEKAMALPYHAVVCDLNLDELQRTYDRKFPDKLDLLQDFLARVLPLLEVVIPSCVKSILCKCRLERWERRGRGRAGPRQTTNLHSL